MKPTFKLPRQKPQTIQSATELVKKWDNYINEGASSKNAAEKMLISRKTLHNYKQMLKINKVEFKCPENTTMGELRVKI